jgi:hypothetical protein
MESVIMSATLKQLKMDCHLSLSLILRNFPMKLNRTLLMNNTNNKIIICKFKIVKVTRKIFSNHKLFKINKRFKIKNKQNKYKNKISNKV